MAGKTSALALITLAYIACIAAGAAVLYGLHLPALWDTLVADVVATIVIFAFSRAFKNSSFYDAYWSVIPPLLAIYWFTTRAPGIDMTRAVLDRKSTRLNSRHKCAHRLPSSA